METNMAKTPIISYKINSANIHINNSYLIDKPKDIVNIISYLKDICKNDVLSKRSVNSLKREWIAHNNLYKLGYKRSRTQDVDLEYPQSFFYKVGYWILSLIKL